MFVISAILLVLVLGALTYWAVLALGSIRFLPPPTLRPPTNRFIITLPAHDEEAVIAATVERLLALDYPADLFSVHIVADHCSDATAAKARAAGATVHERNSGPRTGKGAALSWLFEQVLADPNSGDAVIIFDADTRVAPDFLKVMDARLAEGHQVIQGQHIISNPEAGWFPALTWAMFLVDNRYQNLGRSNLGLSAKHMGDSICFRADILRRFGWGEGLTEDYQLRQRLLLENIKIYYAPRAKGYGEAALTWQQAKAQRKRWLQGTIDAGKSLGQDLLKQALRRRAKALIDGALQVYLPSFSTLTLISGFMVVLHLLLALLGLVPLSAVFFGWVAVVLILLVYPLFGLLLEKAPLRAYLAMLSGPLFIFWRTWLVLSARFGRQKVEWIRTEHTGVDEPDSDQPAISTKP